MIASCGYLHMTERGKRFIIWRNDLRYSVYYYQYDGVFAIL